MEALFFYQPLASFPYFRIISFSYDATISHAMTGRSPNVM